MKTNRFSSLKFYRVLGGSSSAHPFRQKDFPGFSARDLRNLEIYYASQLVRHQTPEERVGWKTAESQKVRFEALAGVAPLGGSRVLDVGCGLGGFWSYLRKKNISVDYTGVDLFPRVIQAAKQSHPGGKFMVRNLLLHPFPKGHFDYAFLSGVFNVKVRDNWKYMRALLGSVLRQTRKAVAFNVLNAEAGLREDNRFSAMPRDLTAFARKLGVSRVNLLDHYHHLDLTLYLFK